MTKRAILLLALLGLIAAYSLFSLYNIDNSSEELSTQNIKPETNLSTDHTKPFVNSQRNLLPNSPKQAKQTKIDTNQEQASDLPVEFKVVGIAVSSEEDEEYEEANQIAILLNYQEILYSYQINDYLLDTEMQLISTNKDHITIAFNNKEYTKNLSPPNLLAQTHNKEKSYEEYLKMTKQEIGTRPRVIEHIMTFTPTAFIADGVLISPGVNPELFEQAGLQEDDVLKTINGKSVTIESELEEVKRSISSAHTLVFVVMRKGQLLTLYLDIPSESLSFTD